MWSTDSVISLNKFRKIRQTITVLYNKFKDVSVITVKTCVHVHLCCKFKITRLLYQLDKHFDADFLEKNFFCVKNRNRFSLF